VLHTNNLPALTTPQKVRCRYPVPVFATRSNDGGRACARGAMLAIAVVVDTRLFLGRQGVSSSVTRMAG